VTDPLLLEAMREVDELTPACPPITPSFRGRVDIDQSFAELEQRELPAPPRWRARMSCGPRVFAAGARSPAGC
jgi:hypothetical protein